MNKFIPLAFLLAAVAGCQETPQETQRDVAEARADGQEAVRQAEQDRREVQRDANDPNARGVGGTVMGNYDADRERANADYDVAATRAQAALDVEQERCEGLTGDERDRCKDAAEAVYDKAIADAELKRTNALRQSSGDRNPPAN